MLSLQLTLPMQTAKPHVDRAAVTATRKQSSALQSGRCSAPEHQYYIARRGQGSCRRGQGSCQKGRASGNLTWGQLVLAALFWLCSCPSTVWAFLACWDQPRGRLWSWGWRPHAPQGLQASLTQCPAAPGVPAWVTPAQSMKIADQSAVVSGCKVPG